MVRALFGERTVLSPLRTPLDHVEVLQTCNVLQQLVISTGMYGRERYSTENFNQMARLHGIHVHLTGNLLEIPIVVTFGPDLRL